MNEAELREFLLAQDKQLKALASREHPETSARLLAIEQHLTAHPGGGSSTMSSHGQSIGELITTDERFALVQKGARSSGAIPVKSFKTIVSGSWSSPPLHLPIISTLPQRRLTVRDLLNVIPTSQNAIEYAAENVVTSGVAYQVAEGDVKGQTDITYVLKSEPIVTLAHWLACSRQLVADSQAFSGYINQRLGYLLALKEEAELLFGTGTGHLHGIVPQASAMTGSGSSNPIDQIALAIAQLEGSDYECDSVVLNRGDWWAIRRQKSTQNTYIAGDPMQAIPENIWGVNVVATNSMPSGQFLCGSFKAGASLFDREQAVLELSREHSDFFVRNLVAILTEERLALVVFQSKAFVTGTLPVGS